MNIQYNEVDSKAMIELFGNKTFLLVTATDTETENLHNELKPLVGDVGILKCYEGNHSYYIGLLGLYPVVHVQCGMGGISREGSLATTTAAIQTWKPLAVLMPGIAFGIDREKQQIGDVLLAEAVIPYDIQRVGEEQVIYRSPIPPSNLTLLNRFKNIRDWEYMLPGDVCARLIVCHILSGEKLLDNEIDRDKLAKAFPNAKGGEMEGAGLYSACDGASVPWLIAKGICDFADGNKGKHKKEYQKTAIKSALSMFIKALSSKYAFKELGIKPVDDLLSYDKHSTIFNMISPDALENNDSTDYKPLLDSKTDAGQSILRELERLLSQLWSNEIFQKEICRSFGFDDYKNTDCKQVVNKVYHTPVHTMVSNLDVVFSNLKEEKQNSHENISKLWEVFYLIIMEVLFISVSINEDKKNISEHRYIISVKATNPTLSEIIYAVINDKRPDYKRSDSFGKEGRSWPHGKNHIDSVSDILDKKVEALTGFNREATFLRAKKELWKLLIPDKTEYDLKKNTYFNNYMIQKQRKKKSPYIAGDFFANTEELKKEFPGLFIIKFSNNEGGKIKIDIEDDILCSSLRSFFEEKPDKPKGE